MKNEEEFTIIEIEATNDEQVKKSKKIGTIVLESLLIGFLGVNLASGLTTIKCALNYNDSVSIAGLITGILTSYVNAKILEIEFQKEILKQNVKKNEDNINENSKTNLKIAKEYLKIISGSILFISAYLSLGLIKSQDNLVEQIACGLSSLFTTGYSVTFFDQLLLKSDNEKQKVK